MPQVHHPVNHKSYDAATFSPETVAKFFSSIPFPIGSIRITTEVYPDKLGTKLGFTFWSRESAPLPGTVNATINTESIDGRSSDYISITGLQNEAEVLSALRYLQSFEDIIALRTMISVSQNHSII